MQSSEEQRRSAFSVWLRTGQWPKIGTGRAHEVKFNPWHDPNDGRFTFSGTGRYYGLGGGSQVGDRGKGIPKIAYREDPSLVQIWTREEVEAWKADQLAKHGRKPGYRAAIEVQYRRYLDKIAHRVPAQATRDADRGAFRGGGGSFGGGGASGSWGPSPAGHGKSEMPGRQAGQARAGGFVGGGGVFGGGGASGSWELPESQPVSSPSNPSDDAARHRDRLGASASAHRAQSGGASGEPRHTLRRNGYTYEIDARGRTRRVSGALSVSAAPVRSRANQAQAGGLDRRASDDGGHYIAVRFNGPTEAFNHFAQDANLNRGRYRALEDQWARAKRAGKHVTAIIVPYYDGASSRPYEIDVSFTIDGLEKSIKMPNERTEKPRAER